MVPGSSVGAKLLSRVRGHGWEVVEKCISGQRGYEKAGAIRGERGEERGEMRDAMPVVVIKEEKEKPRKTWYIMLYEKLFGEKHQKYKVDI